MNLFVQGMRRSGTTILYDALLADRELRCFYEPLREQDVTEGGGSGAREGDAFAETRALRERFQRERYPHVPIDEFNWGGPRSQDLELERELPEHCRELLRWLLGFAPAVAIKETRLYRKVAEAFTLDPGAALVHVVRDPRSVAASIILGRKKGRLRRWSSQSDIFAERTDRKLWSSRALSRLLPAPDGRSVEGLSDVEHILRVGTEAAMDSLYRMLGRDAPEPVREWARANVREPEEVLAGDDPRWAELCERHGLGEAIAAAGYGELAATLSA